MSWAPIRKALAVGTPLVTALESVDSILGIGGPAADITLKVIKSIFAELQSSLAAGKDPVTTGAAIAALADQHRAAFDNAQEQRNATVDQELADQFKAPTS